MSLAVDPTTMTAFMRRLGAERHRLRPQAVVRVRVHPRAYALLEQLANALYQQPLAAVVDVAVLAEDSCDLSEVRCETF
ncbi:MAG: hypothetical protein AB7G65_20005 [Thermoleophilia bacterium]